MSGAKLRFLSGSDVRRALPMAQAVETMKEAFADLSAGLVTMPPRTHMALAEAAGDALFMPAYNPSQARMGVKIVTLFESVGVAVQDLAAAAKALENAEQMGLGTELEL